MNGRKFFFAAFALLALFLAFAAPVSAAPVQVPQPPVARASVLPVVAEIGQQIQALVTGEEGGEIEPQETFGTRALGVLMTSFNILRSEGLARIVDFAALPQFATWMEQQMTDKSLSVRWMLIGQRLIVVVGGAFVAGWVTSFLLMPLRRRVKRHEPKNMWGRFSALVAWFLLSLLPVIVFVGTSVALMDPSEPMKLVRYFVMTVVYALAVFRIIRLLSRFILAPRTPSLRFVPLTTGQAAYMHRWVSIFGVFILAGYYGTDLARLVRMPAAVVAAFNSIIGLIVVLLALFVILQKRAFVSAFIRGDVSAASARNSLWDGLRLWLARTWHVLAISYVLVGFLVTAFSTSGGGFETMQRGTILTLMVLLGMRLAFHAVSKLSLARDKDRAMFSAGIYRPVLQILLRLATWVMGAAGILAAWGADVGAFIASAWGQRILGSVFSITSTIVLVVLIYEALQTAIDRRLNQRDSQGNVLAVNPRAQTLLPMLRNAAIMVLGVVVGLVTLSELGINIRPLLAGAGVLGVAIGFGSQTLVKDFLTGLFIVLEDTIAVGDVVKIADNAGTVEGITIRTVRLRDQQGALHIVPFSEITRIINQTKGFSFAVIDVGVAYDSDLEKVMDVMRQIGASLRADPEYAAFIMEDAEMLGVETLGDFSITIRCRIKTVPGQQWIVRRAYLLRVKERFEAEKIEIPFPVVAQVQKG